MTSRRRRLASVTSEGTDEENIPGMSATGSVSNENEQDPFLQVTFDIPDISQSGMYMCRITPTIGIRRQVYERVSAEELGNSDIVTLFRSLRDDVSELTEAVNAEVCSPGQAVQISLLTSSLFIASDVHAGHRYYMSTVSSASFLNVEASCLAMGGYLAEVDTQEELVFLQTFLHPRISRRQLVLISATDEESEGVWVHRQSGTTASIFDWFPSAPNDSQGTKNCLSFLWYFNEATGVKMKDVSCSYVEGATVWQHSYLCEVPEADSVIRNNCPA
ncbi:uncharacterized protein LOC101849399 [Aplysia californica]|uniref:Uncharacterized protein LOC101849399 n=1 Tax=Aplysia californica TaxID=6500 RepID=A0ABM1A7F0_APLCA|nr:uncharacterized protein LOC101849399 [Aplysia californica]